MGRDQINNALATDTLVSGSMLNLVLSRVTEPDLPPKDKE